MELASTTRRNGAYGHEACESRRLAQRVPTPKGDSWEGIPITRFIQSRWTGAQHIPSKRVAKEIVNTSAVLIWRRYWMVFWMFEKTFRPSSTATIMVAKLSSAKIMSNSFRNFCTCIPIPIPISAVFKAGASLTPSPVLGNDLTLVLPCFLIRTLCSGETRA